MKYRIADEVKEVGEQLTRSVHQSLERARIVYLFTLETPLSKGKEVWGKAKKISGLNAFLASQDFIDVPDYEAEEDSQNLDFFVIEIAMPVWNRMNAKKRIALVDHELSHCFLDSDGKYQLIPHDIEEFDGVVRRNGIYRDDVQRFVDVASRQMPLPMDAAPGDSTKVTVLKRGANGKDSEVATFTAGQLKRAADKLRNKKTRGGRSRGAHKGV